MNALAGLAIRVPLTNASITDCVFEVEKPTTVEEVNRLLKEASEGELRGILGFESRPLVSTDYINDARSSIVDEACTQVIDGTMVKIYAWVRFANPLHCMTDCYLKNSSMLLYFCSMIMNTGIPIDLWTWLEWWPNRCRNLV